jgi:two-component system phosphate regulon sensor histidine kinase PhoR
VVDEAVRAFEPRRHRNPDMDFSIEVAPDLPPVLVDRAAMVDAIDNLLSNAVKYGGTPLRVILRARLVPDGVGFEVTDNGDGIPRSEHRRIFLKFYRIDDRLSREREGSGLGLAIVRHIVRAHHGRVMLESAKGQGSTFSIVVPAMKPTKVLATGAQAGVEAGGQS